MKPYFSELQKVFSTCTLWEFCVLSLSLHACLHGAATLRVGSPSLPAADFALELGAAFELEVVGANSTTLGLIHPRACTTALM